MHFYGEPDQRQESASPRGALRRGTYVGEVTDATGVPILTDRVLDSGPPPPVRWRTPQPVHGHRRGAFQEHVDACGQRIMQLQSPQKGSGDLGDS